MGSVQRSLGAAKPNIVVIFADAPGFSDIGCHGAEIHTPNLDRLSAEGLRFVRVYNVAQCCPASTESHFETDCAACTSRLMSPCLCDDEIQGNPGPWPIPKITRQNAGVQILNTTLPNFWTCFVSYLKGNARDSQILSCNSLPLLSLRIHKRKPLKLVHILLITGRAFVTGIRVCVAFVKKTRVWRVFFVEVFSV